ILTKRQLPLTPSRSRRTGTGNAAASATRYLNRSARALPQALPLPARGERAGVRGLLQVLAEIGLDIAPQFLRRRFAVARPVIGEKGVSGGLGDLCRGVLAGGLGALLELGFERDRRVLVVFPDY